MAYTYTITDAEEERIWEVAKVHGGRKLSTSRGFNRVYSTTEQYLQAHNIALGIKGELCCARTLGIPYSIDFLYEDDGGRDLSVNGYTIQVKAARYPFGKFIQLPGKSHLAADFGVLVVPHVERKGKLFDPFSAHDYRTWRVTGWISREEFEARKIYQSIGGHTAKWHVRHENLNKDIDRLKDMLYGRERKLAA